MSRPLLLEPSRIFAEIEARPPLMRDQITGMYLGQHIDWMLTFRNGSKDDRGQARLIFSTQPYGIQMVTGTVRLPDYPGLKSLPSGKAVRVRGRIRKIDTNCVDLEITRLTFPKPAEAAH